MIKIPVPREGESQQSFINRCIPYLIHEGKHPNTPKGRKQAAGECYGIWRSSKKSDDEIAKCVKCGLKDAKGYFCRYGKDGEKFYYDINDVDSKHLAKSQAEEFGLNILLNNMSEEESKQEETPKPSGSSSETPPDEEVLSYTIPKSKDELKEGHIVRYNNKVAVIKKKLS